MGKTKRSVEENRRISITTIVILVLLLVSFLFIVIYILFAKVETNKKIESINNEIETIKLDTSILNEEKEEINNLLNNVSDATTYMNILKENYNTSLPAFETRIKSFEEEDKVAYLSFIVDKTDNLDKVIDTLNNNNVLATFFTNDKDTADKIIASGNLIGLYIDDEKVVENINEEYKDIIDTYNPDLFMVSSTLKENDIKIDSFYKVTENSSSEGKKLLNQDGYISDIVDTTADRDFLIIKINLSNGVGVGSIDGIISKLKDKKYIFLPLVSSSSLIEK